LKPHSRNDQSRLDDIRVACSLIVDRLRGKKFPDFVADLSLQDGIIRRLEMIGEAAKNLTEPTKKRFPTIQWRDMMRLRDRAIHRYWDLDSLRLWKITQEDIPQLLELLE
jgi:uncharacterized protein with HEPN domain